MIKKGLIHQEDVAIINLTIEPLRTCSKDWPNCRKKDNSTMVLGDFNSPLSIVDKQLDSKS